MLEKFVKLGSFDFSTYLKSSPKNLRSSKNFIISCFFLSLEVFFADHNNARTGDPISWCWFYSLISFNFLSKNNFIWIFKIFFLFFGNFFQAPKFWIKGLKTCELRSEVMKRDCFVEKWRFQTLTSKKVLVKFWRKG